jgi:hypothetical protein
VINTAADTESVKGSENEPIGEKVVSCGNLLNHGDILLHQSQIEFNSCDVRGDEFRFYLKIKRMDTHSEELK